MLWRAAWMDSGLSEDLFELVGNRGRASAAPPGSRDRLVTEGAGIGAATRRLQHPHCITGDGSWQAAAATTAPTDHNAGC